MRAKLGWILLVASATAVLNCRADHEQASPLERRTLTIGTFSKAYGNLPYYIARHFRWFESSPEFEGIVIRHVEYNDRPSISDALSTGHLQLLFSGDAPALLCRAQGNDIRAVEVSGNAEQEIVVSPSSAIRTIPDLRNKKVAVLQATSSHYALLKILRAHGMAEDSIDLRFMSPPEARVAFEAGQVDAWAVWAPFVEQEQASGKGRVLSGSDALINSLLTVSSQLLEQDSAIVTASVRVVQRAKQWMVDHPREAQAIAAKQLGLSSEVVALAWPKFNWAARLDAGLVRDLQAKIDFLATLDKTRQGRTFNVQRDFVYLAGLQVR